MAKVKCPYHDDLHPSMEAYADGWLHCFVCGAHVPQEKYQRDSGQVVTLERPENKVKEDLKASLAYIDTLPRVKVRGLELPADAESYYVVWPDKSYYTRRFFDSAEGRGRYKRPTGHATPLLVAKVCSLKTILVVEGEINALSIAKVMDTVTVVSPGGSNDFFSKNGLQHVPYYLGFGRQVLIADEDGPGALACIELASRLKGKSRDVQIVLMGRDANDILQEEGEAGLRKEICERAGLAYSMPTRV